MKKNLKIVFALISLCLFSKLFANGNTLTNVPEDYLGTYIPAQMEMLLKEYMSYEKALSTIAASSYDILLLDKDICYSQVEFYDGYAVEAEDFNKWAFVSRGNDKFIIDENGISYRRLCKETGAAGYTAYGEDVLKILCHDVLDNKDISINGNKIKIAGVEYRIELSTFYGSKDCVMNLRNDTGICFMMLDGVSANIVNAVPGEYKMMWEPGTEILQTIPLFYWKDSSYPNINGWKYRNSKKDLRLLRNLFYAKHGYIFKSADLKEIFEKFDWYKPNSKFSENSLSNWEKNCLQDITKYEEQ